MPVDAAQVLDTILERWLSGDQHLNAPVRCGLVVCIPFLRPALRASLAPELARLLQCASEDDDAWVRILARALGSNPTRTDLDAVAADVPPVRSPRTQQRTQPPHSVGGVPTPCGGVRVYCAACV